MMHYRKLLFAHRTIPLDWLTILLGLMGIIVYAGLYFLLRPMAAEITPAESQSSKKIAVSALTPAALDKLIQQAADAKYLRDVLGDKNPQSHLPLPQHVLPLQTADHLLRTSAIAPANVAVSSINQKSAAALQRCTYQQQTYVPGDIVKTPQGWLRCTPVVALNGNVPAAPVWTAVVP